MKFSRPGDLLTVGEEPLLGPGVRGTAFDMPDGLYIPLIRAVRPGTGDVGAFLDGLPTDRRLVFPCVLSGRLAGMLLRRGFLAGVERDGRTGELVEVFQRCPTTAREAP